MRFLYNKCALYLGQKTASNEFVCIGTPPKANCLSLAFSEKTDAKGETQEPLQLH